VRKVIGEFVAAQKRFALVDGPLNVEEAADDARRPVAEHDASGSAGDSCDYLFHLLVVIAQLRDAELDRRLQSLELNVSRYRALAVIDMFGPCTMSAFASFSPLDRTTNSRTVDQLVRSGWVERTRSREDRRRIFVSLTPRGRRVCGRARDIVAKHNKLLIEGLSEDLQAQVIAAQRMLASKLEQRGGQFVDRESLSDSTLAMAPMVS